MPTLDISNLSPTIVPKSDQLNAEQLLGWPMTLHVTDVRIGSDDQPVVIHYDGDSGRPFKPCKTMRKLLIFAWGEDGRNWVGRSMTVYNDAGVKFGGVEVGGIRISHLSHITGDIRVSLTSTKGKKALHEVKMLREPARVDHLGAIKAADSVETLKQAFAAAYKSTKAAPERASFKSAYDARMAALSKPPAHTLHTYTTAIAEATSAEAAALVLDQARDELSEADYAELSQVYSATWEAGA